MSSLPGLALTTARVRPQHGRDYPGHCTTFHARAERVPGTSTAEGEHGRPNPRTLNDESPAQKHSNPPSLTADRLRGHLIRRLWLGESAGPACSEGRSQGRSAGARVACPAVTITFPSLAVSQSSCQSGPGEVAEGAVVLGENVSCSVLPTRDVYHLAPAAWRVRDKGEGWGS